MFSKPKCSGLSSEYNIFSTFRTSNQIEVGRITSWHMKRFLTFLEIGIFTSYLHQNRSFLKKIMFNTFFWFFVLQGITFSLPFNNYFI